MEKQKGYNMTEPFIEMYLLVDDGKKEKAEDEKEKPVIVKEQKIVNKK